MVDLLSHFSFQPVLHVWCNKGCGMCYPVCGMVHIKDPLLLIRKSSPCGGSGFPLSLSGMVLYHKSQHHITVNKTSLNKTFPSFLSLILQTKTVRAPIQLTSINKLTAIAYKPKQYVHRSTTNDPGICTLMACIGKIQLLQLSGIDC